MAGRWLGRARTAIERLYPHPIVRTVNHRFALSNPALPSAPSKKIVLQRQLSNLGMQRLHVDGRLRRPVTAAGAGAENIGSTALKLRLLRCDLVGVKVELLGKLGQRSITLDGGKRHLRLESRCVVPARSSAHDLS